MVKAETVGVVASAALMVLTAVFTVMNAFDGGGARVAPGVAIDGTAPAAAPDAMLVPDDIACDDGTGGCGLADGWIPPGVG